MIRDSAFVDSAEPSTHGVSDGVEADGMLPASPVAEEDVAGGYRAYRAVLERLAGIVQPTRGPAQLETKADAVQEMRNVYAVQAFLARRSFQLRRQLFPTIFQYDLESADPEAGADRGDQIALLYHAAVHPSALTKAPTNWTVTYEPWHVLGIVALLLSDLHHLADRAGVGWRFLLGLADRAYKFE